MRWLVGGGRCVPVDRVGPGAYDPVMFRRDRSLGYQVNHLARLFAQALERRITPLGLSPGQFPAMLVLWESPGISQGELARKVAVEQPTMANTLNRMERDGLIERRPDPDDRRRMLIYPTQHALALRDRAHEAANQVNALATARLSEDHKAQLLDLTNALILALDEDGQ